MILYLRSRAELLAISCDRTISLPASLLEEREPFQGATEVVRRIRQHRLANESTRTINR